MFAREIGAHPRDCNCQFCLFAYGEWMWQVRQQAEEIARAEKFYKILPATDSEWESFLDEVAPRVRRIGHSG